MRKHAILALAVVVVLTGFPAVASARERVFFYHNDHLGTPQVMTDESGATVWKNESYPFGKSLPGYPNEDVDGDGALVVSNLRFPGQYYDAETGLHYNWHRDYDPGVGRYQEADPVGIDEGTNHLYAYAQNDPSRYSDPTGLVCGSGWNDYIVPDHPYGYDFTECCQQHDDCYAGKHGACLKKKKSQCDEDMYNCAIRVCNKVNSGQTCYMAAAIYFKAVKKKGCGAFTNARTTSKCCNRGCE